MINPLVKLLESAGVDYFWDWDVLAGWIPQKFWSPDVFPISSVIPDPDSFWNVNVVNGMVAEAASSLGLVVGMNTMRHGPAENLQSMMTMSSAVNGKAIYTMGTGEAYQCSQFGYSRPIARYQDHFECYKLLLECDGPVDFNGRVWSYKDAYIGTVRTHKPQIWALGSGPKLTEVTARYADGFMTGIPWAYSTPERFAAKVKEIKQKVEAAGRDPEKFGFGIQCVVAVRDNPEEIAKTLAAPGLRWLVAAMGRFNQADWELDGFEPPYPKDYFYTLHHHPTRVPLEDLKLGERVSTEMMNSSFISGTPKECAQQLQAYIDAGATVVCPWDMTLFDASPDDPFGSLAPTLELCQQLKVQNQ